MEINNRRTNKEIVLSAAGMKKSFNRVEVLHGVNFTLKRGEVHGIVGQNGAGKSTLMKIINGVYTRDEGILTIDGETVVYDSPFAARQHGISMVYQEFSLVPSMTVAQNLFLAREPLKGPFIDEKFARKKADQLFKELEVEISPDSLISDLTIGERQIVEIAKALSEDVSILIMDEPTASLSSVEIQSLFKVIRRLKKENISIIFVSHHLNEVITICDRVTVIRDGDVALDDEVSKLKLETIIAAMIGKKFVKQTSRRKTKILYDQPLMQVSGLTLSRYFQDISFSLYPGEVLGIAGVMGCGRSDLLKSLFGVLHAESGDVRLRDKAVRINHPAVAMNQGIIHVPEDRRKNGILSGLSIRMNILLPIWKQLTRLGLIQDKKGDEIVNQFVLDLKVKTTNNDQLVQRLSGGNQQKIVFAKSLATKPNILLLDDPTVGVDVATKNDIAQIIRRIADQGNAIILVSSEMEELVDLCDRVLVMQKGRITKEFDCNKDRVNEEFLMRAIQTI